MKKTMFFMLILLMSAVSHVQAQIEAGLAVPLALSKDVSSKDLKVGDLVEFKVSAEVYDSSGELVIPEGAIAYGTICEKKGRKFFGKEASMELQFEFISLSGGAQIPISADNLMAKGKRNKLTRTLGYLGCFWLATLPFAFVKGGHAKLQAGTSVLAYTK